MAAVFQLDVLAASVPFFQGKCVSAVIPVTDGEYGVLAGHSNAVGAVCAGELRFETENGEHRRAAVAPGLFKIDGDRVLLLLDAAEWPEDIDVNRAPGKLTVKGLKKATKLKEKELYAALGWLAREGKVSMYEVDADIEVVSL